MYYFKKKRKKNVTSAFASKMKMLTQWPSTIGDFVYESRPEMKVKTQDSQGKFGLTTRSQSILREEASRIKVSQMQDN